MVYAEKKALNEVFNRSIINNDRVLLKTILENLRYSRSCQLKELLKVKEDLAGFSALQFVCLQGNYTTASLLIDAGSTDVDEKGLHGWTSLHAASYSGDTRTVQILLNSCTNCFSRDENGNLPIDLSMNDEVSELLTQTMKRKNEELFNELNEQYQFTSRKTQKYERSQSCCPSVSFLKISELRLKSNVEVSPYNMNIRKWKTFSNLSTESIYELTC